jgi:hypothetical protein
MTGCVGNDPRGDRERDSGGDHRRQDSGLAIGALLVRHERILHVGAMTAIRS